MKILVIGSGGREHAVTCKIAESSKVKKIFCAPGNAGTASIATNVDIEVTDLSGLYRFAKEEKIGLTVVGPERPLVDGIVDTFKRSSLRIFGPTREASILEASKSFTKTFCERYNIPTSSAKIFDDATEALAYVSAENRALVVKADGLCAGKGVVVCRDAHEAQQAITKIMVDRAYGDAGKCVVIEEKLVGEEVSFLTISDGNHVLPLASSQDHKRIFDGDRGPNTGGMGAYSPSPIMTDAMYKKVMDRIILPTVRGMVTEGRTFTGVLYAGLMLVDGEPKLLEYNVRFGDPETQPLLMRLKTDLVDVMLKTINGMLERVVLTWDPRPAVCVVMASKGYPENSESGKTIHGLKEASTLSDVCVFHAGTKMQGDDIVTAGGRVLGVTATGSNIAEATRQAYAAVNLLSWDGCHYRKDIAAKAVKGGSLQ